MGGLRIKHFSHLAPAAITPEGLYTGFTVMMNRNLATAYRNFHTVGVPMLTAVGALYCSGGPLAAMTSPLSSPASAGERHSRLALGGASVSGSPSAGVQDIQAALAGQAAQTAQIAPAHSPTPHSGRLCSRNHPVRTPLFNGVHTLFALISCRVVLTAYRTPDAGWFCETDWLVEHA